MKYRNIDDEGLVPMIFLHDGSLFHLHERRSIPSRAYIRTITRGHFAFASGGRKNLFVINYNWCFILA